MKNLRTSRINVMVFDMDRAIEFYVGKLKMTLLNHYGNNYAEIQAPDLLIGLHPSSEKTIKGNNMSIGLGVVNFDDTMAEIESLGIACKLEEEGWIRLAYFCDPDGNQLFLAERKDID